MQWKIGKKSLVHPIQLKTAMTASESLNRCNAVQIDYFYEKVHSARVK